MSYIAVDRDDLSKDQSAISFKIDYQDDLWDISLTYSHVDDAFDPSVGFMARKAINSSRFGLV